MSPVPLSHDGSAVGKRSLRWEGFTCQLCSEAIEALRYEDNVPSYKTRSQWRSPSVA